MLHESPNLDFFFKLIFCRNFYEHSLLSVPSIIYFNVICTLHFFLRQVQYRSLSFPNQAYLQPFKLSWIGKWTDWYFAFCVRQSSAWHTAALKWYWTVPILPEVIMSLQAVKAQTESFWLGLLTVGEKSYNIS